MISMQKRNSKFKRIILTGSTIGNISYLDNYIWNLQHVPNIEENLEYLEITNIARNNESTINGYILKPRFGGFVLGSAKKNSIKHLNLERNWIGDIDESFLRIFTSLRTLKLARNSIKRVANNAFINMPHLERLNLRRNAIIKLEKRLFDTIKNLIYFDVSNNELEELDDGSFSLLKKLEYIDLTRNNIKVLTALTFDGLVSLKVKSILLILI